MDSRRPQPVGCGGKNDGKSAATQSESNRTQKETPKLGARVFRRKTAVYLRVNGSLLASGRLDDIAQAVTRRQTQ